MLRADHRHAFIADNAATDRILTTAIMASHFLGGPPEKAYIRCKIKCGEEKKEIFHMYLRRHSCRMLGTLVLVLVVSKA